MDAYIPSAGKVRTVTDMRERALKLLREARERGPLYIFRRSRPEAVILSVEEYERILEVLDEYYLSLKARGFEKRSAKKEEWLTLAQLTDSLK